MTFTSSSEGPLCSPHLSTHQVSFACQELICVCSENSKRTVLFLTFCCSNLPSPPDEDGVFGRVPQSILDDEGAHLVTTHENSLDLQNMFRVSENAYKQYIKSRPSPSPESFRRVKNTDLSCMAVHPILGQFEGGWTVKMMKLRQELVTAFHWSCYRVRYGEDGTRAPSNRPCHQKLQIQSGELHLAQM